MVERIWFKSSTVKDVSFLYASRSSGVDHNLAFSSAEKEERDGTSLVWTMGENETVVS